MLARPDWSLRLQGGGMVYLIGNNPSYLMTVCGADSSELSAMAGMSRDINEIIDPRFLMVREGQEKALFVVDGKYLRFGFESEEDNSKSPSLEFYLGLKNPEHIVDYESILNNVNIKSLKERKIRTIRFKNGSCYNPDLVVHKVRNDGSISVKKFFCNVSWDSKVAGLDYVRVVDLRRDIKISDLRVYDSEMNESNLLKRNYVLLPLTERFELDRGRECCVMNGFEAAGVIKTESLSKFTIGTTLQNMLDQWKVK